MANPSAADDYRIACAVDAACDRFEADWRAGRKPSVDDVIAAAPPELRDALADELGRLATELACATSARLVLRAIEGPAAGRTFPLEPARPLTAGRVADADIPLADDPFASRRHFTIECHGKIARLVDLGSQNGTYLNGRRVKSPKPLRPGDRVRAGGTTWELLVSDEPNVTERFRLPADAPADAGERFRRRLTRYFESPHPALVPWRDAGRAGDELFVVRPAVTGDTLDVVQGNRGPMTPEVAITLLWPLADALRALHDHGGVHGDLRPADVFVTDGGGIRVVGPGLFVALRKAGIDRGPSPTRAPEALAGRITPAADQFSLAALIVGLMTGEWARSNAEIHTALTRALDPDPARRFERLFLFQRELRPHRRPALDPGI